MAIGHAADLSRTIYLGQRCSAIRAIIQVKRSILDVVPHVSCQQSVSLQVKLTPSTSLEKCSCSTHHQDFDTRAGRCKICGSSCTIVERFAYMQVQLMQVTAQLTNLAQPIKQACFQGLPREHREHVLLYRSTLDPSRSTTCIFMSPDINVVTDDDGRVLRYRDCGDKNMCLITFASRTTILESMFCSHHPP